MDILRQSTCLVVNTNTFLASISSNCTIVVQAGPDAIFYRWGVS